MSHTQRLTYVDFNVAGQLCMTAGWFFSGRIDQVRFERAAQELARQWPEVAGVLRMESEDPKSLVLDIPDKEHAEMGFRIKASGLSAVIGVGGSFMKQDFGTPLATVYTAAPRTDRISLVHPSPGPSIVSPLGTPPFADLPSYLGSPDPVRKNAIHVHLGLFTDAAVLSVWWAHVVLDAGGMQAVVSALISLINNPSAVLPPLLRENPFEEYLKAGEGHPAQPAWRVVSPHGMLAYVGQGQKDAEIDGPMDFARLYFPRAELDRLKGAANEPVSDNDVISSYLWKNLCANPVDSEDRPTRLAFAVDVRPRLPDLFPPHGEQPYLGNARMIVSCGQTISAGDLRRTPIAAFSSRVRNMVREQGSTESVETHLKWLAEVDVKGAGVALPWDSGDRTVYTTNWLRFGLGDLKISKGVIDGEGSGKLLDMYLWSPTIPVQGAALLLKDETGGVWCELSLGKKIFEEDAVRALF